MMITACPSLHKEEGGSRQSPHGQRTMENHWMIYWKRGIGCVLEIILFIFQVDTFNSQRKILTQKGRDLWHSDFVKMPCSQASMASSLQKDSLIIQEK